MTDEKLPRVYAPDATEPGRTVDLDPYETAHVVRSLRLRPGTLLAAFDGKGREFLAELMAGGARTASVRLVARRQAAAEPTVRVVVAQAMLKGQKMDDVIRDTVMLGVTAVQPLLTARTDRVHAGGDPGRRLNRWHRIAASSAGQSGRAVVPVITEPCRFEEYLANGPDGIGVMLVEPSSTDAGTLPAFEANPRAVTLLVGPEGGWTHEETGMASRTGYRLWTLGERTLRADAAAMVGLAVLMGRLGDL